MVLNHFLVWNRLNPSVWCSGLKHSWIIYLDGKKSEQERRRGVCRKRAGERKGRWTPVKEQDQARTRCQELTNRLRIKITPSSHEGMFGYQRFCQPRGLSGIYAEQICRSRRLHSIHCDVKQKDVYSHQSDAVLPRVQAWFNRTNCKSKPFSQLPASNHWLLFAP